MSEDTKEKQNQEGIERKAATRRISEGSARASMDMLMESYDIDPKDLAIENGPEWVDTVVNRLVRAVKTGKLEIMEDGSVIQHLTVPKGDVTSITYRRMNGIAMKSRDKAKSSFEKDLALMESLGNAPASVLVVMDMIDISIMQRLAQLFMVV